MPFCMVNLKFWLLLAQGASTDGTRKHVEKTCGTWWQLQLTLPPRVSTEKAWIQDLLAHEDFLTSRFFSKHRGRGNTYQAVKKKGCSVLVCLRLQADKQGWGLCIGIGHLVRCWITRFESEVPATSPTLPGSHGNCGRMRWGMRGMWAVGKRFLMSENVTAIFLSFGNCLEPLTGVIWI